MQGITWNETRSRLRLDRNRLAGLLGRPADTVGIRFHPSYICVFLFRLSHCLSASGHSLLARLVAHANEFLTGADISPAADIEGGLVILTPAGTALSGKAGRNLTIMPCSGTGGELGRHEDIGGGPGLPVLGDDVTFEPHSGALGPVRIGSRVLVRANLVITSDVPDDTVVEGHLPRMIKAAAK